MALLHSARSLVFIFSKYAAREYLLNLDSLLVIVVCRCLRSRINETVFLFSSSGGHTLASRARFLLYDLSISTDGARSLIKSNKRPKFSKPVTAFRSSKRE